AFKGSYSSPTATKTYTFPEVPNVTITGVSNTEIPLGQTTVMTSISFTRHRQWPNTSYDSNNLNPQCFWGFVVSIDGIVNGDDSHNYSADDAFVITRSFGEGDHTISIVQHETSADDCGLAAKTNYTTGSAFITIHVTKLINATIKNVFKDPGGIIST